MFKNQYLVHSSQLVWFKPSITMAGADMMEIDETDEAIPMHAPLPTYDFDVLRKRNLLDNLLK